MDRAYVQWVDAYGGTRLTWFSYTTGSNPNPFQVALNDTVNPVPASIVSGSVVAGAGTPSTNPYTGVADAALLQFATAAGNLVGLICPGFQESLYLADNQTVDPAQPLVIALVAAAIALPLVDSAANPVTAFIGGLRQKRGY